MELVLTSMYRSMVTISTNCGGARAISRDMNLPTATEGLIHYSEEEERKSEEEEEEEAR